ncbi:MAG: ubiquinone/menaquinone biosynthesis C-methylase UbiE [Psychroserpens sp.]|jgi:ubiquinone/menaquinone biosynthesis C-methylase UbiE
MTWEETIKFIRTQDEYKELVKKAYFEEDLALNVERFQNEEEFAETLKILKAYQPKAEHILDIGCGNGISSISFALQGYKVAAVEPDPSPTIGAGAIRKLKENYHLDNIEVYEAYAEDIHFNDESFDVVYVRQAMHHANDLDKFIAEAGRVLKKGGLLITVRDHVIFDLKDKAWFLEMHPLHKFYGGENAFTTEEYKNAMFKAGLKVEKELKYYDSVINYFPLTETDFKKRREVIIEDRKKSLDRKIGVFSNIGVLFNLYDKLLDIRNGSAFDEKNNPGRMYSYIAIKK